MCASLCLCRFLGSAQCLTAVVRNARRKNTVLQLKYSKMQRNTLMNGVLFFRAPYKVEIRIRPWETISCLFRSDNALRDVVRIASTYGQWRFGLFYALRRHTPSLPRESHGTTMVPCLRIPWDNHGCMVRLPFIPAYLSTN